MTSNDWSVINFTCLRTVCFWPAELLLLLRTLPTLWTYETPAKCFSFYGNCKHKNINFWHQLFKRWTALSTV